MFDKDYSRSRHDDDSSSSPHVRVARSDSRFVVLGVCDDQT